MRLAVWSGPRNISTALMRSFGQIMPVVDEPLYAYYLTRTGLDHPGRAQIVGSQPTDWREVVRGLDASPEPSYEKHMAHHLLPEVDLDWVVRRTNVLLIRHPAEVIASYARMRADITAEDLGLPQQVRILNALGERGQPVIVVDSEDLLRDPAGVLQGICERAGLEWKPSMLAWPPGPRPEDGVWAPHWYASVEQSTGFAPWQDRSRDVPARYERLLGPLLTAYRTLRAAAKNTRTK